MGCCLMKWTGHQPSGSAPPCAGWTPLSPTASGSPSAPPAPTRCVPCCCRCCCCCFQTPLSVPTPRDCCYSCGWSQARHIATGAPLPCRIFQPNEFACPHPQGPFKFGRATYDATGATIQGPPECCSYTFNEASWGLNSKVDIRVRVCVHCCSRLPECCSCTYNEANL